MAAPMSEKEKVYFMCLLFPIFWPLIPALLICDLCNAIGNGIRGAYWRWKYRNERDEQKPSDNV